MQNEICECCSCGYQWKKGMNGAHSCVENLLKTIEELKEQNEMKSWAFNRPYCNPSSGILQAKTAEEALKLVHSAYGFASDTSVYCAETEERLVDNRHI